MLYFHVHFIYLLAEVLNNISCFAAVDPDKPVNQMGKWCNVFNYEERSQMQQPFAYVHDRLGICVDITGVRHTRPALNYQCCEVNKGQACTSCAMYARDIVAHPNRPKAPAAGPLRVADYRQMFHTSLPVLQVHCDSHVGMGEVLCCTRCVVALCNPLRRCFGVTCSQRALVMAEITLVAHYNCRTR